MQQLAIVTGIFVALLSDYFLAGVAGGSAEAVALDVTSDESVAAALAAILFVLAFTSVLADFYYGESNIRFMTRSRVTMGVYRFAVLVCVFMGAVLALEVAQLAAFSEDIRAHLVGVREALQGNLDPALLFAPWGVVEREVRRILDEGRAAPGHIFNLGHGVLPDTDPVVLTRVVELVHEVSSR